MWSPPWEIRNIILDAGVDLSRFSVVRCDHIFRESNRAADFMAHRGHFCASLLYSFPPYNVDFSLIVRKDVLGWPPD